jgi:hypothetical protein
MERTLRSLDHTSIRHGENIPNSVGLAPMNLLYLGSQFKDKVKQRNFANDPKVVSETIFQAWQKALFRLAD